MVRSLYARLMFFHFLLVGLAGAVFWLLAIRWDWPEPLSLMVVAGVAWLLSALVVGLLLHPLDQLLQALQRLSQGVPVPLGPLPGPDGAAWRRVHEALLARLAARGPADAGQASGPALSEPRGGTVEHGELRPLPAALGLVLDGLSEGVLLLDRDFEPLLANLALRSMATAETSEGTGLSGYRTAFHTRCFVPDQLALIEDEMRHHPDRPRTDIIQLERPRQFLRRYGAPLQDDRGRCAGFLVSYQDITREVEQDRLRQDFIANASHELRTPVTSVKLLLENLVEGAKDDPAVADEFLADALREMERMHTLVNDLLDLAALESGRDTLQIAPLAIATVIAEAVETVAPQAKQREVALRTDLPETSLDLEGDASRLRQVLVNLVANAVKFTPSGGTVTLRAWGESERVHLAIADTGIGIPAKDLPHIFDRFFRVTRNRSRLQGGSGLGLTIVKQAVDAHRGEIHVESTEGQGTTVYLALPVRQAVAD
ncbi:MAG: ATP-binding protein [Candidatus Sericytochromatia bacterium]|nr:ATP-binding protein [Candidatus Sericytochromatia bacterium]